MITRRSKSGTSSTFPSLEHSDFGLESIRDYAVELVRNTPIGLMVLQVDTTEDNTEFRILSVNPAVMETVGMRNTKVEDLVGKTIREVFPSLCNRPLATSLLEVLRCGKPRHLGEIPYRDARVSEGVFSAQAFPLPNRCLGIAVENITERRRAEDTLRASEAKFRNFLDSAPDAFVISDEQGRMLLVNSQTERLFGYPREELFGRPVDLLVPEQFRAQHERHRKEYLINPHVRPMGIGVELLGLHKDGREFPVEISLSALQTPEGLLVCSAIRDIAERKRAESALKRTAADLSRSNAELEQFAYAASHDLQEPLRTVVSATQVLAKDFGDKLEPDARQWIMFATQGAKRMQTLLNALLDYARLNASHKSPERVDCRRIYETTVADLRTAIAESNAEVTADSLPIVLGDTVQLRQVFQNLIANALKFRSNDRPPRIHISAEQRDNEWRIAVRDNGIGIDPKNFGRLFVLFQRLHSGQQYRGTGIGLAICKKIVEQHGGRIGVESVPGQGSTFYFTLPVADPQILAQIQANAKPATDTDRIFKGPG